MDSQDSGSLIITIDFNEVSLERLLATSEEVYRQLGKSAVDAAIQVRRDRAANIRRDLSTRIDLEADSPATSDFTSSNPTVLPG